MIDWRAQVSEQLDLHNQAHPSQGGPPSGAEHVVRSLTGLKQCPGHPAADVAEPTVRTAQDHVRHQRFETLQTPLGNGETMTDLSKHPGKCLDVNKVFGPISPR